MQWCVVRRDGGQESAGGMDVVGVTTPLQDFSNWPAGQGQLRARGTCPFAFFGETASHRESSNAMEPLPEAGAVPPWKGQMVNIKREGKILPA